MTRPLVDPRPLLVDGGDTRYDTRGAVAAERARIMRQLDYSVSKSLLGVSMIAESLATHVSSAHSLELDRRLRELARLARDAVSDARSFINGLREEAGLGIHREVDLPEPAIASQWLRDAPQAPPVRVIIADENPVLRRGLRACLERSPRIEIAAEADNGQRATVLIRMHRPDVLLLDVHMLRPGEMPDIPQIGEQTQVVMLACPDDADLVMRAVEAGASGYVIHGEFEPDELIQIVLDAGRRIPALASVAGGRSRTAGLRPREREVMGLIAEGLTNRQISARLVISEKTVKNHICSIYQHLGVHERSQAVSRWQELVQSSAPPPGPLFSVEQRGVWPVEARAPRHSDRRHSGMDVQLA